MPVPPSNTTEDPGSRFDVHEPWGRRSRRSNTGSVEPNVGGLVHVQKGSTLA